MPCASLYSFVIWLLFLEILSIPTIPILAKAFPHYPDKAYGLTKTFGFLLFGLLTWLIPSYLPINTGFNFCAATLVGLFLFSYFIGGTPKFYCDFLAQNRKLIIRTEILFILGLSIFTLIRALNPEIFWGEKPMDSALLHFFTRLDHLPPTDPWSSGTMMRYYYLGTLLFASLLKLTGIDVAIGYNLAVATVPALCLISVHTLFQALSRKAIYSVLATLAVVFLSNLEILNLIFLQDKGVNFDTYWAATRLFTPPGFTEYPLWSFLFADLHAHVVSQIACALLLAMIPGFIFTRPSNTTIKQLVLIGITLASLMLLNTWDFLVYGFLTSIVLLAKAIVDSSGSFSKRLKSIIYSLVRNASLLSAIGIIIAVPYMKAADPSSAAHWGWNGVSEYNTTGQVLLHFGVWLALSFMAFIYILMRYAKRKQLGALEVSISCLFAIIPIVLGLITHNKGLTPPPWGILIISTFLIQLSLIGIFLSRAQSLIIFFPCLCLLTIGLMLGFVEVLFLIDRMNSVFKFYNSFWLLFATSSVALGMLLFQKNKIKSQKVKATVLSLKGISIVLVLACFIGGMINIYISINHRRTQGPILTLNGQSYLKEENRSEYEMIQWINSNIQGMPVILEAHGEPYGPYTRIVMHTGLSTVLGWEHHVKQRGTKESDVSTRKSDIRRIYQTPDIKEAEMLLEKYHVDLIVVGKLERTAYRGPGIDKFENNPAYYPILFRGQDTLLFVRARSIMSTALYTPITLKW